MEISRQKKNLDGKGVEETRDGRETRNKNEERIRYLEKMSNIPEKRKSYLEEKRRREP